MLVGGAELPGLTFSPHQSDLRCGPLCWPGSPLRDRSESFLIPIPPAKSFHPFFNGIHETRNTEQPILWAIHGSCGNPGLFGALVGHTAKIKSREGKITAKPQLR